MITNSLNNLLYLPLGGTAVGTCLNAEKNFDKKVISEINLELKTKFKIQNKFHGLSFKDDLVYAHSTLKVLCTNLYKIANDIRFLSSGPRCGYNEIIIPNNEPGSSIMPGKINPTQCEALMMVCLQVFGNDSTISLANSQGNFQLNTFMPLIALNYVSSLQLISDVLNSFSKLCLDGLKPNKTKMDDNVNNSLMLITALTSKIGYEKAAQVANYANEKNLSLKQAALNLKIVNDEKEFDKLVNPSLMI